jgi:hypothetical protein
MMTNEHVDNKSETHAPAPRFHELQQMVAAMASDFEKFYKDGNKAAGTRVRLAMQELKNFAQTIRTEVQSIKTGPGGAKTDADAADDKE